MLWLGRKRAGRGPWRQGGPTAAPAVSAETRTGSSSCAGGGGCGARAGDAGATGNGRAIRKHEPRPSSETTHRYPPMRRTSMAVVTSPRPVPWCFAPAGLLIWEKGLNRRSWEARGIPTPKSCGRQRNGGGRAQGGVACGEEDGAGGCAPG